MTSTPSSTSSASAELGTPWDGALDAAAGFGQAPLMQLNKNLVVTLLVCAVAVLGCGDGGDNGLHGDGGTESDVDGDGLPNEDDPTPGGSTLNLLNSELTGGRARVVEIAAVDANGLADPDLVYDPQLDAPCNDSWAPPGVLCDDDTDTASSRHDPDVSVRENANSGATWEAIDGEALVRGQLVIDACAAGGCDAIDFREARVFQMFSDGKVSGIRVFIHPARGNSAPAWDDDEWQELGAQTSVGAGASSDGGATVTAPTVIDFGATHVTRYVRIEAINDATHGFSSYTEVRAVKFFGAPPPS